MLHPRGPRQPNPTTRSEVQEALTRFPDATVVLHGEPEVFDVVEPLMADHANLVYSFDFPTWAGGPGGASWGGAVVQSGSPEQFLFSMERLGGIDGVAKRGVKLVGERAAKHADRSMLGSDRFQTWHFDPRVGQAVVEVNRRILGQMPAELQEPLAFGNAERVLGPFLVT